MKVKEVRELSTEEINKKLDNKEIQENSRQTKTLEEINEKLDNDETQE